MKKTLRLFLMPVVLCVMLTSCGKNNPKDVADTWLNSFNHMEFEQAIKVSTNETKNLLESLQELTKGISDSGRAEVKKIKVTIKDVKEAGDNALVTYTSSDNAHEQTLNLVKQNDKWLVQFTKTDLVGTVAKDEEEAEPQAPTNDSVTITTPTENTNSQ